MERHDVAIAGGTRSLFLLLVLLKTVEASMTAAINVIYQLTRTHLRYR